MHTEGVGNIQEYIIFSEKNFFLHLNFEGWLHCFFAWHGVAFSKTTQGEKAYMLLLEIVKHDYLRNGLVFG